MPVALPSPIVTVGAPRGLPGVPATGCLPDAGVHSAGACPAAYNPADAAPPAHLPPPTYIATAHAAPPTPSLPRARLPRSSGCPWLGVRLTAPLHVHAVPNLPMNALPRRPTYPTTCRSLRAWWIRYNHHRFSGTTYPRYPWNSLVALTTDVTWPHRLPSCSRCHAPYTPSTIAATPVYSRHTPVMPQRPACNAAAAWPTAYLAGAVAWRAAYTLPPSIRVAPPILHPSRSASSRSTCAGLHRCSPSAPACSGDVDGGR